MGSKVSFKNITYNIVIYSFLSVIAISVIFPIFYSITCSFKSTGEILSSGSPIPKEWVFDNYIRAFKEANFARYSFNSIFITLITTTISLFNVTAAGFCIARSKMRGKKVIHGIILVFMFISLGPMTLFPKILMVRQMGLGDTIWGIIIGMVGGFGPPCLIFDAYFKGQGGEIDEAAIIDGCNFFKRFFRIGIPLAKPLIGTFAVMFFNSSWNNFFWPYVMSFNNDNIRPLIVAVIALRDTLGTAATEWGLLLAGATMAILPVTILYVITSKWVISGITEGSIKF